MLLLKREAASENILDNPDKRSMVRIYSYYFDRNDLSAYIDCCLKDMEIVYSYGTSKSTNIKDAMERTDLIDFITSNIIKEIKESIKKMYDILSKNNNTYIFALGSMIFEYNISIDIVKERPYSTKLFNLDSMNCTNETSFNSFENVKSAITENIEKLYEKICTEVLGVSLNRFK